MTTRYTMWYVAAILVLAAGASVAAMLSAAAATPACGARCISIFSKELGNYKQPGPVEDVQDGNAVAGTAIVLKQGSASDVSQDLIPTGGHVVADFYRSGMVSAAVNSRYGSLKAAQIEYAPEGKATGLCVGLANAPYENEALTLQPCSVPALTVWIIDTADSPATAAAGYFPIVNASTADFRRPYAMSLSQAEIANRQTLRIYVHRLQFSKPGGVLPDWQLWGAHFGTLTP